MEKGKAIYIEGIDGSGKSTQATLLRDYLVSQNHDVHLLREPGGSGYYEALRHIAISKGYDRPPLSDALLSGAGEAANLALTRSLLAKGSWVISDRAFPSMFVYQGAQGLDPATIEKVHRIAVGDFHYDLQVIIDIPIEVSRARLATSRATKDRWESRGDTFFEDARRRYLDFAKSRNITILDGSQSIEAVQTELTRLVSALS